jgi:mono/diheme cytochrome c family protein
MITAAALSFALAGQPSLLHAAGDDLAAGKRIYLELCKSCHGLDGKGPGEMKLTPPAADLTSREVQSKLDSRLYNSIHNGRANTAMGAWKHTLTAKEVLDVISYVRTFRNPSSQP